MKTSLRILHLGGLLGNSIADSTELKKLIFHVSIQSLLLTPTIQTSERPTKSAELGGVSALKAHKHCDLLH